MEKRGCQLGYIAINSYPRFLKIIHSVGVFPNPSKEGENKVGNSSIDLISRTEVAGRRWWSKW